MQDDVKKNEAMWDPMDVFYCSSNSKYAMIVLNQPILLTKSLILPMWKKAQITICVDGGTNRWMEYLNEIPGEIYLGNCSEYIPTLITGDFDSISPDIITKLEKIGAAAIKTPCQNDTDFTKAIMQLGAECKRRNIHLDDVYVLVENSGRFDQIMANVNTLYKCKKIMNNVRVINIASNSLTWLLHPGRHVIKIPEILRKNNSWVGLIPFGTSTNNIKTSGLKWNLDNTFIAFGSMISTSNTYDGSPEVIVTTDVEIVWTMGIESLVKLENGLCES